MTKTIGAEAHPGRLFHDGAYTNHQLWVKHSDYEALRQRFERACGRISQLESTQVEPGALLAQDTGGGCSVCGSLPVVNVEGTYWLCGPCVLERLSNVPLRTT